MSPRYANTDVDEVRERADILEVIGEHVRLRRQGRQHVGLCPFHQEKTGSFYVSPDKGVYHCHGCHAGGNVFTFLQQVEGLSFTEAVEQLAQRYGVRLQEVSGDRRQTSPRSRLLTLHEAAVEHYQRLLAHKEGGPARSYLEERSVDVETRDRYRVGFGGWTPNGLTAAMTRAGFTVEELVAAGLARRDGRAVRDVFVGRVLFPIFDPSDRPIGFGGRVLPERFRVRSAPDSPKYLNTRETQLFKKSRVLYGVNWSRGEIVRSRRLVLVEGYTDVIALHRTGVGDAVATCGTSMTEQHMQEISRRFGDVRVVLCLDGDAAGQAAAGRTSTEELAGSYSPGERVTGGTWLPVGRGWLPEVYVAVLPPGRDPADFALQEGPDAMGKVLDRSVPLVRFLLERSLDVPGAPPDTPEGRTQAVRRGADVLAGVGDSLLRHEYALWLAGRTGVDPLEVARAVEQRVGRSPQTRKSPQDRDATAPVALTGHHRVEREALRALCSDPELFADPSCAPVDDDFTLPLHRTLFRLLSNERDEHRSIDLGKIAGSLTDGDLRRAASELAVGPLHDRTAAREMLVRLKGFALGRRIEEKKATLRTLDPEREAEAYDALFEELLELEKQRRLVSRGDVNG